MDDRQTAFPSPFGGTQTSLGDVMRARADFERSVVVWLAWIIYAQRRYGPMAE